MVYCASGGEPMQTVTGQDERSVTHGPPCTTGCNSLLLKLIRPPAIRVIESPHISVEVARDDRRDRDRPGANTVCTASSCLPSSALAEHPYPSTPSSQRVVAACSVTTHL